MAVHDYVIDNSTGANVRADINSVLQAILTNNSSSSSPSTTAAYMFWADTTNGVLKIRNSADNAWIELLQLDGTLTLEDGSNSAPALAFRDDLDTGIYSSDANKFNVATGGVERMELGTTTIFNEDGADVDFRIEGDTDANLFLLDAGNDIVNIGSTINFAKFGVFKTVAFDATINSANAHIGIGSGSGSGTNCQALLYFSPLNSSGNRSPAAIQGIASGNSASDLVFVVNTSNNFGQTPNTEMLRLTATKNLGIKQSSPAKDIHIGASGADQKTTIRMEGTNGSSELQRFDIENDGENARVNLKLGVGGGTPGTKMTLLSTGGITFNGDTATANALDDYEEGTWTPAIGYQNSSGLTIGTNSASGKYTKIGRLVMVIGCINFSVSGSPVNDNIFVSGLPFNTGTGAVSTGDTRFAGCNVRIDNTSDDTSIYMVGSYGNFAFNLGVQQDMGNRANEIGGNANMVVRVQVWYHTA
tara:strand:+ start:1247 stop:2668 length:1422 start_codon:yes stop_codon:yes gene_type:complete